MILAGLVSAGSTGRAAEFIGLPLPVPVEESFTTSFDMDAAGNTIMVSAETSSFVWRKEQPLTEVPHGQPAELPLADLLAVSHDGQAFIGRTNDQFVVLRDGEFTAISNVGFFSILSGVPRWDNVDTNHDGTAFIAAPVLDTGTGPPILWDGSDAVRLQRRTDLPTLPPGGGILEGPFAMAMQMSRDGQTIIGFTLRVARCYDPVSESLDPLCGVSKYVTLWRKDAAGVFVPEGWGPVADAVSNIPRAVSTNEVVVGQWRPEADGPERCAGT